MILSNFREIVVFTKCLFFVTSLIADLLLLSIYFVDNYAKNVDELGSEHHEKTHFNEPSCTLFNVMCLGRIIPLFCIDPIKVSKFSVFLETFPFVPPRSLRGAYYLHPSDTGGIILQCDLCNGTCSVNRGGLRTGGTS